MTVSPVIPVKMTDLQWLNCPWDVFATVPASGMVAWLWLWVLRAWVLFLWIRLIMGQWICHGYLFANEICFAAALAELKGFWISCWFFYTTQGKKHVSNFRQVHDLTSLRDPPATSPSNFGWWEDPLPIYDVGSKKIQHEIDRCIFMIYVVHIQRW